MTPAYQITINPYDNIYFAYKDGKMLKMAFHGGQVPIEYHNLFAAAPMMYERLDKFSQHAHRLQGMLETLQATHVGLPEHAELFKNLETFFQNVKQDFLLTMRVAEVGYKKALADSANDV